MYDIRDFGTYLIMLLVLPLFAVVFGIVLIVAAPFWLARELYRRLHNHA